MPPFVMIRVYCFSEIWTEVEKKRCQLGAQNMVNKKEEKNGKER